jgi:hypothetical protein
MESNDAPIRELFVEELAEIKGGYDPLEKLGIWQWINEHLYTTLACGEEGPC